MNRQPHLATNRGQVPIGIWPCDPTPDEYDQLPELVERLTPALLRRVLAEFAQPDDTVAFAGISAAALHRVQTFDIAALAVDGPGTPTTPPRPRRADHSPDNGLIVAAIADPAAADPDTYQRWRRRLRPGGVLVVLTACPAGAVIFANNAGIVVTGATAAGLVYQQHIVAIHARIANDRLLAPPDHSPDRRGGYVIVQHPVHSDLLVFTKPADAAGPGSPVQTAGGVR